MYFIIFLHFYVVQFKLGLLMYILSSFYIFILCLDLININKKSLMVITNNYDTKKEKLPKHY